MPHARPVAVSMYVGAGNRYEDESTSGVSHYLEHMFFKDVLHLHPARFTGHLPDHRLRDHVHGGRRGDAEGEGVGDFRLET